jgi:pyroglutamyl-peptidase
VTNYSPLLLTSFDTWLHHQISNSSDDLLQLIHQQSPLDLALVRRLPVETNLAAQRVIAEIEQFQPRGVVCCGMAADRPNLTIEIQAFSDSYFPSAPASTLLAPQTSTADLTQVVAGLKTTTLSDDAGKFVCEGLYYAVLSHLRKSPKPIPCIFVHVPLLTPENQQEILTDFSLILNNLANSGKIKREA